MGALFRAHATTLAVLVSACDSGGVGVASWQAVTDTVADTVIVRTISGSAWGEGARLVSEVTIGVLDGEETDMFGNVRGLAVGPEGEIYVVDGQVPALRVYGPDGVYRTTLGRRGEGPGEYSNLDGGLAVLSDGRVVLRDPGNGRFNVYSPDGTPLATWPVQGNFTTSRPLYRDLLDNVWTLVLTNPGAPVQEWVMGLARYGPDGTPGDTLFEPTFDYEPPMVVGESETRTSVNLVPFSATPQWTMTSEGDLVAGLPTSYTFTLHREGFPLRVERLVEPVAVRSAEASQEREAISANMREIFPGWTWNGPDLPSHKPAYQQLHAAVDGRIWVLASGRGFEVPNENHDPEDPASLPTRWREEVIFDVFEPDGRYLGWVEAPEEMVRIPEPVFGADLVWAVTQDDLGVQRVVRFRIERGPEGSDDDSGAAVFSPPDPQHPPDRGSGTPS